MSGGTEMMFGAKNRKIVYLQGLLSTCHSKGMELTMALNRATVQVKRLTEDNDALVKTVDELRLKARRDV